MVTMSPEDVKRFIKLKPEWGEMIEKHEEFMVKYREKGEGTGTERNGILHSIQSSEIDHKIHRHNKARAETVGSGRTNGEYDRVFLSPCHKYDEGKPGHSCKSAIKPSESD